MERNEIIGRDLNLVVKTVLSHTKNLRSIMLAGGFGRDEGAVVSIHGEYTPINDYDIYLIGDHPLNKRKLDEIYNSCNKELKREKNSTFLDKSSQNTESGHHFFNIVDNFFVDGHFMTLKQLERVPPLIRFWEMRRTSKILWGEDVRPMIRDIKQEELPLGEGIRFMCNQLSTLVRMWGTTDIEPYTYFACRTWTSYATALLLMIKTLKPTYRERALTFGQVFQKEFPDLAEKLPTLAEDIEFCTEFKINPDFTYFKNKNLLEFWIKTRDAGLQVMEYYLNKWMGTTSLEEGFKKLPHYYYTPYLDDYFTLGGYLNVPIQLFLSIKYSYRILKEKRKLWFPHSWISPDMQLWKVLPHVLEGLPKNEFNKRKINQIPYPATSKKSYQWENVQRRYINAHDIAKKVR